MFCLFLQRNKWQYNQQSSQDSNNVGIGFSVNLAAEDWASRRRQQRNLARRLTCQIQKGGEEREKEVKNVQHSVIQHEQT